MSGRCQSEAIAINQNILQQLQRGTWTETAVDVPLVGWWCVGFPGMGCSQSVADHIFHRGVYFRSIDRSVVIKLQIGNGRQVICETFSDTKVAASPKPHSYRSGRRWCVDNEELLFLPGIKYISEVSVQCHILLRNILCPTRINWPLLARYQGRGISSTLGLGFDGESGNAFIYCSDRLSVSNGIAVGVENRKWNIILMESIRLQKRHS